MTDDDKHIDRLYRIIDALLLTVDNLRTQCNDMEGALKASLMNRHCSPEPEPIVQQNNDKQGLQALFDEAPIYRHVCSKDKKHPVRCNRIANGQRCNVCKAPMNSSLVVRKGKRKKK